MVIENHVKALTLNRRSLRYFGLVLFYADHVFVIMFV